MLIDGCGRKVNYLRISVTERCNFRCQYCMPDKPFSWVPKENLLSFEELFLFIKAAMDEGITKVRITGGEPLLRTDLDKFIAMIYNYNKDVDLALTTNAYLLKGCAKNLKDAGLKRLNISLDSLKPESALKIAQKDVLKNVLLGIQEAQKVGLKIKINMVPIKGINDNEIIDILDFCKKLGVEVRFIEYMENAMASSSIKGLLSKDILALIREKHTVTELGRKDASPSVSYQIEDGYKFGLIDPHKHDFCEDCNRIRLTAEGNLIPCLYFDEAMSIKDAVRSNDIPKAVEILKTVLKEKPKENRWSDDESSNRAFYETGG